MILDVAAENTYINTIFPAGIIVRKPDNIFYLTDGTHSLRQLSPIVDQVLNTSEKTALRNAFSSGNYIRAANGAVVHNNLGKIDDASLNLVDSGKLKVSYLSDFVENNLIKYVKLPEEVKQSFYVVNTYGDLITLNAEQRKKLIVVKDASGDPSNNITGSGLYYYNNAWISVLAVANNSLTYEDLQNLGAVMYDHMIHVTTTSSNIRNVLDKLVIGEVTPEEPPPEEPPEEPIDTVHDEDLEYSEIGWVDFINNVNSMVNGPSGDVYFAGEELDNYSKTSFVIISDELDLAHTTITLTNTTTNDTVTLPVAALVQNSSDMAVVEYNRDDPAIQAFVNDDNADERRNQIVHVVVTDNSITYTLDDRMSYYFYSLPDQNVNSEYDDWVRNP
jgi:hypothetical protein